MNVVLYVPQAKAGSNPARVALPRHQVKRSFGSSQAGTGPRIERGTRRPGRSRSIAKAVDGADAVVSA